MLEHAQRFQIYNKKGQLEWEAFNAGNDVLCFAENNPEGIKKS
jgi:phosphoserine phosphatase